MATYYIVFGEGRVLYVGEDVKAQIKAVQNHPDVPVRMETADSAEEAIQVIERLRGQSDVEALAADTVIEESDRTVADVAKEVFNGLESVGVDKVKVDDFIKRIQVNGDEFIESARQMGIKGAVKAGDMLVKLGTYLKRVGDSDQTNE